MRHHSMEQHQGDIASAGAECRHVVLGDLTFDLDESGLRYLRWKGIEVVRAISAPLRDENWGSLIPQTVRGDFETTSDSATLTRVSRYLDGALEARLAIQARANGSVVATFEASASRDISVNRAGFTVLHPIAGVAGQPVRLTSTDHNMTQENRFPSLVMPSQPMTRIAALEHDVFGVRVFIAFEGEAFEMEDQRNWSDASFKTYCRPLSLPFPYLIRKGEMLRQEIRISLSGTPAKPVETRSVGGTFRSPDILMAIEAGWQDANPIDASGVLLRVYPDDGAAMVSDMKNVLPDGGYVDVELVVSEKENPDKALVRLKQHLDAAGIAARHVIALPETYLKSYQPDGPWPKGLTPTECADAAARVFPHATVGNGMLTNFTELNRCRKQSARGSYVTHGNSAIVHAADDLSVFETLDALPDIFETGREIAQGRAYRLGLMSIGMRSNPYGAGLEANPDGRRITMTDRDPRQQELFGAAYAIGVASKAADAGIEALALAAPTGPFGIRDDDGSLRPIFHAVRALSGLAAERVSLVVDLAPGVIGLRSENAMVLANCSLSAARFPAPVKTASILDETQLAAAAGDADWLTKAVSELPAEIALAPCACLFSGLEGTS